MTLTKQRVFSLWEKNVGYYKLGSEDLLTAHMQNHIELEPAFECNDCGKEFGRKVQYDRHMKTYHTSANVVTKQYNCEDCPFQSENSLELKKHVHRSRHTPSQTTEKCYTCKQEFWSERSACAALGCWHKRRWPLLVRAECVRCPWLLE